MAKRYLPFMQGKETSGPLLLYGDVIGQDDGRPGYPSGTGHRLYAGSPVLTFQYA